MPSGDIEGQRRIINNLRRFVDMVPFGTMQPRPELGSGCVCLAEEGRTYAAFAPRGGPHLLYLLERRRYQLTWCRVADGEICSGGDVGGGMARLVPPFEGASAALLRWEGD
jgi:hypothetical protein